MAEENNNWVKVLESDIPLKLQAKILPTEGNLVYEYNPLRNYRLTGLMYEYNDSLYSLYSLYTLYGITINMGYYVDEKDTPFNQGVSNNDKILYYKDMPSGARNYVAASEDQVGETGEYADYVLVDNSNYTEQLEWCYASTRNADRKSFEDALSGCRYLWWLGVADNVTNPVLRESGELVDFVTDELDFSLENPVSIVPQYSYDGSVNLIINDGKNIPRLINSRFSATGKNTYEIVDRKGDNDTNIYDQGEQFDIDTSLYKRTTKIPRLSFGGVVVGGNLKSGNYHFYFKLADADGNETDFVAESGLVSVFIGHTNPSAVSTGSSDENCVKSVRFTLSNIDASYNYAHVYYSRNSAQLGQSSQTSCFRIEKRYTVNNAQECSILVTGYEETTQVTATDINLQYNIASAVGTAVECQNMLMMGNIHKIDIPYDELADLSLRFLPYVKETIYPLDMDRNYNISSTSKGYYDPDYIYTNVGYWGGEFYRLGIVYIMPDNELTPVFNIRGRCDVYPFGVNIVVNEESKSHFIDNTVNDGQYNHYNLYKTADDGTQERVKITMDETDYYVLDPAADEGEKAIDHNYWENAKGVVTFHPVHDTDTVYAIDIRVDDDVLQELKKYVKGYFFVRQERIPTVLCQAIMIGLDCNSYTPTIPTQGGFLTEMADSLDGSTYVEVEDINDVNYISEGFLSRYSFSLKRSSSGIWKTIGMIVAAVAVVATVVALSVVTYGVATAGIAMSLSAIGSAMAGAATAVGVTTGVVAVAGAVVGATVEGVRAVVRTTESKKLEGRNTDIPSGYKRSENDDSRLLSKDFRDRVIIMDPTKNSVSVAICPDYEVDQPYYNMLFTGNEHVLRTAISQSTNRLQGYSSDFFTNEENHFYIPSYYDTDTQTEYTCRVQGVEDDVTLMCIGTDKFRSRAGWAEEAWHYESVGADWDEDDEKINAEIIRGSFGPYLAVTGYPSYPCDTVNIMIPGYTDGNTSDYVGIRMDDDSSYFAISDRLAMEDTDEWLVEPLSQIVGTEDRGCGYTWELYRGDCYICQVTHRLNRNFNDPSAPYNDLIVDKKTWKDNYDPDDVEKLGEINLGDVNAVKLGMWLTFRIRSTHNLNIRSVDGSNVDEKIMCGHDRGYYPYLPMETEGSYKTPEAAVYNAGFKKSVGERYNFALPDVPYIKNWFGTRIMYSDIHVNDAFKNGFRVFRGTSYIDCPRTYGEIVKLEELNGYLLVVFEHGVALITVTPSNVQKNISEGYNDMNVYNALSEPVIISDVYGSQWADSVMKTPGIFGEGVTYVYGVDTVAKKIWRTNGQSLECISDMKVQKFLNDNITLGERETTPVIGIRNVKTFYNSYKKDVLFTFYDNLSGFSEKVWNLCWSEPLSSFVTFYSWVPSFMEDINNVPFSFNRNTSKWIAKLGVSHAGSSFADGITLTNNIIENTWEASVDCDSTDRFTTDIMDSTGAVTSAQFELYTGGEYKEGKHYWFLDTDTQTGAEVDYRKGLVGILGITGVNMPTGEDIIYKVDYSIERDNFQNYKCFEIKKIGYYNNSYTSLSGIDIPVYGLYLAEGVTVTGTLASETYYRNIKGNNYSDWESNRRKVVREGAVEGESVTLESAIEDNLPIYKNRSGKRLTLDGEDRINMDKVVRLLNVKAKIYGFYAGADPTVSEYFYNYARENASSDSYEESTEEFIYVIDKEKGEESTGVWVDCGYYETVVAVIPRWNMQFLSTDFWKHGQAGIIDIADRIYPAYWYGEQHPFEFEFVVRNDAIMSMILTNVEIHANRVKPESLHFEVLGDVYDFREDMVNMYYRQEAVKALWQWNGADLMYNDDFLLTQPSQRKVSADLPHSYYARQDTFNEIYDTYKSLTASNKDYDHINGAETVYDPVMDKYSVWAHQKLVDEDSFAGDSTSKAKYDGKWVYDDDGWEGARALIASNCRYMEDSWHCVVNPIVVCYRNEYDLKTSQGDLSDGNTLWQSPSRPPLTVLNSPLPPDADGNTIFPSGEIGEDDFPEVLTDLGYGIADLDGVNWLDDVDIHGYEWGGEGSACNREEVPVRGRFVKVRVRYTGDELAVIDFINSIYHFSVK